METESIQQRISLKDERLDVDHIDQYHLSFFIGIQSCEICVLDDKRKRIVLFESIALNTELSLLENLKAIHHDHILVSAGFWQTVSITFRNQSFAQVPNDIYSADYIYDYLKLNTQTNPLEEEYVSTLDEQTGCTTVFPVPIELIRWIEGKYPKPQIFFRHQSANFLQVIQPLADVSKDSLFINLTEDVMLLAGYKEGNLAIYNQFVLKTPQQAAKMILLSIKQFTDSGQATPIILWGVEKSIKAYASALKKYFKELKLGERPKGLKMSHAFDLLKDYEYFDVLGAHH